jgi:hypothetical protein
MIAGHENAGKAANVGSNALLGRKFRPWEYTIFVQSV